MMARLDLLGSHWQPPPGNICYGLVWNHSSVFSVLRSYMGESNCPTAGDCSPSEIKLIAVIENCSCITLIIFGRERFSWAAHCLATTPVLESLLAGFNTEEEELVRQLVNYQGEDWLQSLQEEENVSTRYLKVAEILGLTWEASLWGLLESLNSGKPVRAQHLVHASLEVFRAKQEEKCKLQLSRAVERADRVMVTAQLICLGEAEPAVGLLLDSDPGEENYMADQLLACLIQVTDKITCPDMWLRPIFMTLFQINPL